MIIADTGFWLALANRRDRHHAAAVAWLTRAEEGLVTTWPAVTECCHLLLSRLGGHAQNAFVASLREGICELFAIEPGHLPRIDALMQPAHRSNPMRGSFREMSIATSSDAEDLDFLRPIGPTMIRLQLAYTTE